MDKPLHVATALVEDVEVSTPAGRRAWFKMECWQPIGSFKIRGIGLLCQQEAARGTKHFVASSGGNAGLAVAYAARRLGLTATVVVPSTTAKSTIRLLMSHGAEVLNHGDVWDETDVFARKLAARPHTAYVHPFDNPVLWEGHASLIDEIAASGPKPDKVVVSVGGGGLLCGVIEGLRRCGWHDVEVIAVETDGAHSFQQSVAAGRLVTLPAVTSIAKSLGARTVAARALELTRTHAVKSVSVADDTALSACVRFARSHRTFVEPACGAALSIVYDNHEALGDARNVAVVACGGVSVGSVLEAFSPSVA